MIVWYLDLQLPMQSVLITTNVLSSNLNQGEVYNVCQSIVFSGSSGFRHDIAEILLKVALNTIKQIEYTLDILRNKNMCFMSCYRFCTGRGPIITIFFLFLSDYSM